MSNNSYFGGIAAGLKTLAIGMKTTMKEYFTPKSTEQYPRTARLHSTYLHVSVVAWSSFVMRTRLTSVWVVHCVRSHALTIPSRS